MLELRQHHQRCIEVFLDLLLDIVVTEGQHDPHGVLLVVEGGLQLVVQSPDELLRDGTESDHSSAHVDQDQTLGRQVVLLVPVHGHRCDPGDVRVADDYVLHPIWSPVERDLGVDRVVLAVVGTNLVHLHQHRPGLSGWTTIV